MLEPRSQNYEAARNYLAAGDLDRAERFTRGLLADDALDPRAALLMHDICKARGLATQWCLNLASESVDHWRAELAARNAEPEAAPAAAPSEDGPQARIEVLEAEIAALKSSPPPGLMATLSRLFTR
jgi:lipopolysaccharide biosynthesis regulator YciM